MPQAPLVPEDQNSPLAIAWVCIQTLIAKNDQLARVVKTFNLGDGTKDANEWLPPNVSMMPWVRISPITSPTRIGSESEWQTKLTIGYELAVAGSRYADIINLCSLFIGALSMSTEFPLGEVLPYYRAKNIRVVEVREAAIGARIPSGDNQQSAIGYQYARGSLTADVYWDMISLP